LLLLVDVAEELAGFVNPVPGGFAGMEEEVKVELVVAPSVLDVCVALETRNSVTVDALGGPMIVRLVGAGASNVSSVTCVQSSEAQQCQSRSFTL
jgi:hypothetical protein